MRQIEARAPCGATRRVDGRYVVVHLAVGIEGEPLAQEGQPVGEIEGAEACAGIVGAELLVCGRRGDTEEALQKRMQSDWPMAFSAPDDRALKAEFQILCRSEADLLKMHPGVARIDHVGLSCTRIRRIGNVRVAVQTTDHEFVAKRSGHVGQPGNVQRLDAIDAERIDVLGVIGVRKSGAHGRPEPLVLLSERELVMENVRRDVGFENAGVDCCIDRAQRNRHLMVGLARDRIDEWYEIDSESCCARAGE